MSKIFYDHLIKFEKIEIYIKEVTTTHEEKHELWEIIDKLVHNRVMNKILNLLPKHHHEEFTELLQNHPYDKNIIKFLNEASEDDIEKHLRSELENLEKELLRELFEDE